MPQSNSSHHVLALPPSPAASGRSRSVASRRLAATVACSLVALTVALGRPQAQIVVSDGVVISQGQVVGGRGTAQARQIPTGSAELSGIVTAADSGRPLRGARVSLSGPSDVPLSPGRRGQLGPRGAGPAVAGPGGESGARGRGTSTAAAGGGGLALNRNAVTGPDGRFLFDRLPGGRFTLSVNKSQFLAANYGQRAPGRAGRPIAMTDGQRLSVTVPMIRSGVIAGTVIDESGEPLAGARVQAVRRAFQSGAPRIQTFASVAADDRGAYRLSGLQPGDYFVSVTPSPSDLLLGDRVEAEQTAFDAAYRAAAELTPGVAPRVVAIEGLSQPVGSTGFVPVYFPAAPSIASATSVHLGPGDTREGVDVYAQFVRAGGIRGTVTGVNLAEVRVQVSVTSADPAWGSGTTFGAAILPDGSFTVGALPPGDYTVFAQIAPTPVLVPPGGPVVLPPAPAAPPDGKWAVAAATVTGSAMATVVLTMESGRRVSGRVRFPAGSAPDSSRARVALTLAPLAMGGPQPFRAGPLSATLAPDGTFDFTNVPPGRYSFRAGGISSAMLNGVDVMDFPFEVGTEHDVEGIEVTIGSSPSVLTGTITEASGAPAFDYVLIAAADDARFWTPGTRRVAVARPGPSGEFTFNLPPGGYYLAAVTDLEPGGEGDPEFLRDLVAGAIRVVLGEGGRVQQNIRVADGG